jgi:hypothetical protein
LTTPRSSDTARSSSGARRLGRMGNPPNIHEKGGLAVLLGVGSGSGKGGRRNACLYLPPEMTD